MSLGVGPFSGLRSSIEVLRQWKQKTVEVEDEEEEGGMGRQKQ